MSEAEPSCMQRLAAQPGNLRADRADAVGRSSAAAAIDRITNQRVTQIGKVNPDLVGPPGGQAALDEGGLILKGALDPIMGNRGFSPSHPNDSHFFAVYRIAADVSRDLSRGPG